MPAYVATASGKFGCKVSLVSYTDMNLLLTTTGGNGIAIMSTPVGDTQNHMRLSQSSANLAFSPFEGLSLYSLAGDM